MRPQHSRCYVCDSDRLTPRWVIDGFNIVRCDVCSLVFVRDRLTLDELGEFYAREEIADNFVYTDPANLPNLNYYFLKLRDLIGRYKSGGRILDLGCSSGAFLDVMDGWERHGIEFSGPYADKAIAKYGRNIHCGTLDDYPCEDNYFDVITLQDVFDHVPDPLQALRACRRILKPHGLIVIKVHNISCLYAKVTGRRFYALLPPFHLSYFNRHSLGEALTRTGFGGAQVLYIGHLLSLKTIAYRLSQCGQPGFFYTIYKALDASPFGNVAVRKNLRDIITVVATKNA